jgi:hypothetical protein
MVTQLAVDFGSVLLNVLAIIGIIVAGGFIIFFLGDLLISIYDPENSAFRLKKNKTNQQEHNYTIEQQPQPFKLQEPQKPQELTYNPTQTYREVDFNKALEQEKMLRGESNSPIVETPIFYSEPVKTQEPATPVFETISQPQPQPQNQFASTDPQDIFAQLRAEEEKYKQEKLKAAADTESKRVFAEVERKKHEEEAKQDFDDDDFDFDDIFFSDDEEDEEQPQENVGKQNIFEQEKDEQDLFEGFKQLETLTETQEEQEAEEQKQQVEQSENQTTEDEIVEDEEDLMEDEVVEQQPAEQTPAVDPQEFENLKAEYEQLQQKVAQLMAEKQKEAEKFEQEKQQLELQLKSKPVVAPEMRSVEELEAHLEELEQRLQFNTKELRNIKKEYIPLRKVRKTLENDKKKLRRKEALVAKQKIILYGVNNIAEIDQEKAKKLQEDLDLLDGLRLSVQHCEEVIRNSEERYPILETLFNILTKNIEKIKEDIAQTQKAIENAKKNANQ